MTKEIQVTNDEKSRGLFRGISLFGLRLAIFTAARFALVLLIALSLSCSSKRIAKANVDQVTEGMSKKQVESILGPPTSLKTEDLVITKKTTYLYRQGQDTVTIVFKDDKVQSKDSTLSD
jgi:SmpA / OmlA family